MSDQCYIEPAAEADYATPGGCTATNTKFSFLAVSVSRETFTTTCQCGAEALIPVTTDFGTPT